MESLGNKLRSTRESKGYQFDLISREINIAGRYLAALEAEDFSIFPGEPYILGFLRNYSEYLGLDPQEILSLYRALKIQEQPIPVEQLLKPPSVLPKILLRALIVLLILAALGGGAYFILNYTPPERTVAAEIHTATEYLLNENFLERRFYRGDSILVPLGGSQYKIELSNLGEVLTITTPVGGIILDLSQEAKVDLNNDGITDLQIVVADFAKNDPSTGALLRFELNTTPPLEGETAADAVPNADQAPETAVLNNTGLANATTIFTSPNSYPFTLQLVFQGYCMFRWEILFERDRQIRNEQYFQRAAELSIQAQNGIRMWVSNAAAVKLQAIGGGRTVPLELGGAGEVVVVDVRWVRDEDNRYRLVLIRLE
ncbi:MAG: helix-turn-helix domain-containing protein [Treponema sp.]|nr:helix-turn-helix domain-containing protein [Treponema sp.]